MYEMTNEHLTLRVQLSEGEEPSAVENADGWVTVADGSVWSATFLSYAEIGRILRRWATTGEAEGGRFFSCHDLVIIRDPGVDEMLAAATDLVITEHYLDVLSLVEDD